MHYYFAMQLHNPGTFCHTKVLGNRGFFFFNKAKEIGLLKRGTIDEHKQMVLIKRLAT